MRRYKPWFRAQDGWWYVSIRVDGKMRQRKLVEGHDKEAEAEMALHHLLGQLGRSSGPPRTFTIPTLCAEFLKAHSTEFSKKTYSWYLHYLELFSNYADCEIHELTPAYVRTWADGRRWSDASRHAAYTCLKRVMNWAVENRYLTDSPLKGLKRPGCGRRTRIITADEHARMVAASESEFADFLTALLGTGARPGELRALTKEMVRLDRGYWELPVHKTVKKTGKPRRIYLSPAMIELTKRLLAEVPEGSEHLFRNEQGKPWTLNAVRLRMQRLRQKLKLDPDVVAYSYRHTYATEALQQGIAPQFVAELLGHSSLDMLVDHYNQIHQKSDKLREVVTQIGAAEEA